MRELYQIRNSLLRSEALLAGQVIRLSNGPSAGESALTAPPPADCAASHRPLKWRGHWTDTTCPSCMAERFWYVAALMFSLMNCTEPSAIRK